MIKLVVCDWNRTLFQDKYEEIFFKGLYNCALINAFKQMDVLKICSLWKIKNKCSKLFKLFEINNDYRCVTTAMDMLNKSVIAGLEVSFINKYTGEYARSAINRLDKRILEPLRTIRASNGVKLGIISSGYSKGIERTLVNAGYIFDFVIANDFETQNNKLSRFNINVFSNKKEILQKLLTDSGISSDETVYVGDDKQDEQCLRMVGYPIISFLAENDCKEYFTKTMQAFMPTTSNDFILYLKTLTS